MQNPLIIIRPLCVSIISTEQGHSAAHCILYITMFVHAGKSAGIIYMINDVYAVNGLHITDIESRLCNILQSPQVDMNMLYRHRISRDESKSKESLGCAHTPPHQKASSQWGTSFMMGLQPN